MCICGLCLFDCNALSIIVLCRLQEKHIREKLRDHLQSIVSMQTELMAVQRKVLDTEAKITSTNDRQQRLLESASR